MAKSTFWRNYSTGGKLSDTERNALRRLQDRPPYTKTSGDGPPQGPPTGNNYAYADPPEKGKPIYTVNKAPNKSSNIYAMNKGISLGQGFYKSLKADDETMDATIRVTPENLNSVMASIQKAVKENREALVTIGYPSLNNEIARQERAMEAGNKIPVVLHSVISSNVRRIGYSPLNEVVYIQFKGGPIYYYENQSADNYRQLMTAASHGHETWVLYNWPIMYGGGISYGKTFTPLDTQEYFKFE
jgi:hypothetical protein